MVSQHFCPDPTVPPAMTHAAGPPPTDATPDMPHTLNEGRPTARGKGSTGRGLCVLHDGPSYVE